MTTPASSQGRARERREARRSDSGGSATVSGGSGETREGGERTREARRRRRRGARRPDAMTEKARRTQRGGEGGTRRDRRVTSDEAHGIEMIHSFTIARRNGESPLTKERRAPRERGGFSDSRPPIF